MLKRRVTVSISDERGNKWDEEYVEGNRGSFTEEDGDLNMWAEDLIGNFNAGLRPGDHKRHLENVVIDEIRVDDLDEDEDEDEEDDLDDDLEDEDEEEDEDIDIDDE